MNPTASVASVPRGSLENSSRAADISKAVSMPNTSDSSRDRTVATVQSATSGASSGGPPT